MDSVPCFMCERGNDIGRHRSLFVLPNGFPITPLHLLLAPEHREGMEAADLDSAVDFARAFPDYLVFHNMRGAGASRPAHLHYQCVLADEALPIEVAPRRELFTMAGTTVARVEDYPAFALAVRGAWAAEVTFAILRLLQPGPFNLVLRGEETIVVPRWRETPSDFPSPFGALEMAGCVVLTDDEHYRKLQRADVWEAIRECGLSARAQEAFEDSLRRTLFRVDGTKLSGAGQLAESSKPDQTGCSRQCQGPQLAQPSSPERGAVSPGGN